MTSSPLPANPAFRPGAIPFGIPATLHEFNGTDGKYPEANLIAVNGVLYGTTYSTNTEPGVVFRITPSGKFKVLHAFGKSGDGAQPGTGPLILVKGELYGVTTYGGTGNGTVYKITTTGKERVVYRFQDPPDGDAPYGSLAYVNGDLYGTTVEGGKYDYGVIFRLSLSGKETVLHSFAGTAGKDGQAPYGGLIAVGHTLYGTTRNGGTYGDGTVFKVSLTGQEKVIHSFGGTLHNNDGSAPVAGLAYVKGQLYGTTQTGGASGTWGAVYAVTTSGKERVLHSFTGIPDGGTPLYSNLVNINGTLYGTTQVGGTGPGTVFKVTPSGSESVVYSFTLTSGGQNPYGGLAYTHGRLYGTTYQGGTAGDGTIFSLAP